jgi:pimeloyl-ACP methyl ester carboxylesterase
MLEQVWSLILPDNRGAGLSQAKRPARHLRDYAADQLELLDYLQVDRTHVVGISMGGMIAQWLALDHPQRVDRLVLISTTNQLSPYLEEMARMLGNAAYRMNRKAYERWMGLFVHSPEYVDAHPGFLDLQAELKSVEPISARQIIAQLRCVVCSVPQPRDYCIQSPTLVVAGEYDQLIPNCYGRRMADAIPDSRFLIIPGAGHNLLAESPARLAGVLESFLTDELPEAEVHRSTMGRGGFKPVTMS